MTPEELHRAIEQPAYLVGCELEPGLSDLLLDDVKGQPGALPLLQFALKELWTKRDVRRLTLAAYRAMGGVRGAGGSSGGLMRFIAASTPRSRASAAESSSTSCNSVREPSIRSVASPIASCSHKIPSGLKRSAKSSFASLILKPA